MFRLRHGLSTDTSIDAPSIPSSNQQVPNPHPVPSSRNAPAGFVAASVLSNEPVKTSEFIENQSAASGKKFGRTGVASGGGPPLLTFYFSTCLLAIFAQLSLSVTVRLNTGLWL